MQGIRWLWRWKLPACRTCQSRSGDLAASVCTPTAGLSWPKRNDLMKLAGLGVCLFLSQLFYITGIELSGVVVATCMQARQYLHAGKGVLLAFPGCPGIVA